MSVDHSKSKFATASFQKEVFQCHIPLADAKSIDVTYTCSTKRKPSLFLACSYSIKLVRMMNQIRYSSHSFKRCKQKNKQILNHDQILSIFADDIFVYNNSNRYR